VAGSGAGDGGVNDYDAATTDLDEELRHWPGFYLESLERSVSWGGLDDHDEWKPDVGAYRRGRDTQSWCATVGEDGWEFEREKFYCWESTIPAAIRAVADEMRERRSNPHLFHIADPQREGYFLVGCEQCEREAHELFDDEVEWEPSA
jgi:hypothetical protein